MRALRCSLTALALALAATCAGPDEPEPPDAGPPPAADAGERADASALPDAQALPPDAGEPPDASAEPPDASLGGPDAACDLLGQTGCPEGAKCTVTDLRGTVGCGPAGEGADGAPCLGDEDCAAGYFCASVGEQRPTECHAFCATDLDCPQADDALQQLNASLPQLPGAVLCSRVEGCDPLLQDCPAPAMACYPTGARGACYPAGSGGPGAPCTFANDCLPGTTCVVPAGGDASCRSLCDPEGPGGPGCPDGEQCRVLAGGAAGACR